MILDSSAIVAIVREEAGWERLYEVMATAESLSMSAASYVEMGVVVDNADDPSLSRRLDHLLERAGVEIAAVDADQARLARAAHRDFGRGTGHPARLNFGDCFSYALATQRRDSLLFVGDDFGHTDVRPAGR